MTASALLVHVSGGLIEAHTGALDPAAVYNHPDAVAHPWKWALIHGAFVTAAGVASVVTWRLNEIVRGEAAESYRRARESERALAARERETRHIRETAQDAFVSIDERGVITDWNAQAVTTFGWAREEALGRALSQTIVPERYRDAHERGLARFLVTSGSRVLGKRLEFVAVDRAGREFPVELTISSLQTAAGYVFHAFLHDIAERKQADELLERRRRRPADGQSVARLSSWGSNPGTDVIEWSHELCRIYGVDPAAHPARLEGFLECVHPHDRRAVAAAVEAACAKGGPFGVEHRIVRPDGTVRVTCARGEVVIGDDGRPLRVFGTAQDVTERRTGGGDAAPPGGDRQLQRRRDHRQRAERHDRQPESGRAEDLRLRRRTGGRQADHDARSRRSSRPR